MGQFVWRKEGPDSTGIWIRRNSHGREWTPFLVRNLTLCYGSAHDDQWCKVAELPEIAEPTQYREVTAADLLNGPIHCQVSDNGIDWVYRQIVGYVHREEFRYVADAIGQPVAFWSHARTAIDPTTREPKAYRWKKSGAIYRIVGPSQAAGYVIAESNEGTVASYAKSVFSDPNVVEPIYE